MLRPRNGRTGNSSPKGYAIPLARSRRTYRRRGTLGARASAARTASPWSNGWPTDAIRVGEPNGGPSPSPYYFDCVRLEVAVTQCRLGSNVTYGPRVVYGHACRSPARFTGFHGKSANQPAEATSINDSWVPGTSVCKPFLEKEVRLIREVDTVKLLAPAPFRIPNCRVLDAGIVCS
jgi:hypothetical protein